MSLITATTAQAAEKIDLIIDTDPGADDVVALLFALASPQELNIRALTTVAAMYVWTRRRVMRGWPASGQGARRCRSTRALRSR